MATWESVKSYLGSVWSTKVTKEQEQKGKWLSWNPLTLHVIFSQPLQITFVSTQGFNLSNMDYQ